jgi:hypothetical protein
MNIRFNGFCKIISTMLIATFLIYNISWANPDINIGTSGIAGSFSQEGRDIAKVKGCVEYALRDGDKYDPVKSPVEIFLDQEEQKSDDTSIILCRIDERIYAATISKKRNVIGVTRKGSVESIDLMAFEAAKSCQLEFIPVISDNDPLIKEYRDIIDARIPARVVAISPIFSEDVREYAEKNPDKTFVIMPETFFTDPPRVLKSFKDLEDAEKMVKEIKTAIEENREEDARASIESLEKQIAKLPEVLGNVIEKEADFLPSRIENMDVVKEVREEKPVFSEKVLSVTEKILDALIKPSKVILILISCIFMAYFPMVRAASVQKALTGEKTGKESETNIIKVSPDQFKVQGNELLLDTGYAGVPRDLTGYTLEFVFKKGKRARVQLWFKDSNWRNVYSFPKSPVNGIVRFNPATDRRNVNEFKDFTAINAVGAKCFTASGQKIKSILKEIRLVKKGARVQEEAPAVKIKSASRKAPAKLEVSKQPVKGKRSVVSAVSRSIKNVSLYGWKVQNYRDSRAIQSMKMNDDGEIEALADIDGRSVTNSKGEVFIDLQYNMDRKLFDLRNTKVTAQVYIPKELVNRTNPSRPNGIQIFLKDSRWRSQYGTWNNISKSGWMTVSFVPIEDGCPPSGWSERGVEVSVVRLLGIKIAAGGNSTYKGKGTIRIKNVKVEPISNAPKMIADNALDLAWIKQDYVDSQGVFSVERTSKGLEMSMNLVGSDANKSKGEIFLSLREGIQLPGRGKGPQDLSSTRVTVTLEMPGGLVSRPFSGVQIFSKSVDNKDNWSSQYGNWENITKPGEMKLTYTPTTTPQGWDQKGFDPSKIAMLGIKVGTGGGSTSAFKGKIIVKSVKFEKISIQKAPELIITPYLKKVFSKTAPISKGEFNKLSGASMYYSAPTYGHDLGGARGFSTRVKQLERRFRLLESRGVKVVRLFTLCDLRNEAIRFDGKGKPTGYDPRVLNDFIALMNAAKKADIKLILPLFDFNLADGVSYEGDTGAVGEHPNLFLNNDHKKALVETFRKLLTNLKKRMISEGVYDTVLAWEPMNEPELANLNKQGIPSTLPYTQAFVTDFVKLLREVFPGKPVSLSTQKREYLKYWIHLLQSRDIMQIHWYKHMMKKNNLSHSRGELNVPNGVKVIYGEVEPSNIKGNLDKINKNGYDGALFWDDSTYRFIDSPKKLKQFKEWFRGASLIIKKRIHDIEKTVVMRANGLSQGKSGTLYLSGWWMFFAVMVLGKSKVGKKESQTEDMILELQDVIKRTEQERGVLTEEELKEVHGDARRKLVGVKDRILESNDLQGLIKIFKKIHGKSNEAHWVFQELVEAIAERGGVSALYEAGDDLISGGDSVYKRIVLFKAKREIYGIVENISEKDVDKMRYLTVLERACLKLQDVIDRMSKKDLTEKKQRVMFNDLLNETDRVIKSVDSTDDLRVIFIVIEGENGMAHWVRSEFAKMIGSRGGIDALMSTLNEVYGADPASNDRSYVLALEISKLMKESEMVKKERDKINQTLAAKIENRVREDNIPENEQLILSDVIDVINKNIRSQQDKENILKKDADKIRQAQAVNEKLLISSFEEGGLCGIFLDKEGGMLYVIWNYQNERFELIGPESSEFIKMGLIYTMKDPSLGVSKENVKLYVLGEAEPREGAICIYRLADSTNKIKVDSKFSVFSAEKFNTLYANSAVREVSMDIRRASIENVIPRNVLINIDLFTGKDDDGKVMKAILETIALKQRRLNRIFGKNVIGFEFVSLSGQNESLKNRLEIEYKDIAGITAERSKSKDSMEGFVITDIEDGQNYNDRYILPLQGKMSLEYGGDFYNISAIVDLAVALTLLINSEDAEESHERVIALYERLNPDAIGKIDLSVLLKQYIGEYKDIFKAIAIHPAAKLSYEDLLSMHEYVRDVLVKA